MYAFVDESGDHNLDLAVSDNNYNIFVLGGIFIDKVDYEDIDREFKEFKKSFFGGEDFIIHTRELTRPTASFADPRNGVMRIKEKRAEFYTWANDFIRKAPLRSVFSVVQKVAFAHKYKYPANPYELAFENILNRTLYLSSSQAIEIIPECRGHVQDKQIEGEFAKYSIAGTKFHSGEKIRKRIAALTFKEKTENLTGLQLADLMVGPVGRHFLGIKPKPPGNEVAYETVRAKLAGSERLSIPIVP